MTKLPGNFFDGAEAIMTGPRAGRALALVLTSALMMTASSMQENQVSPSQANRASHFSLIGESFEGNRVSIIGEGTPESVGKLRAALANYTSDGNIHPLAREAVGMGARVSINPAISIIPHDDRQAAMAAVGMVMFIQMRGR